MRTILGLGALLLAACHGSDSAAVFTPGTAPVAKPTVTGPIEGGTRGHPLWDSWYDLGELGYVQEEFFVAGSARNAAGEAADYTTRILVARPREAAAFSGTVMLDWTNVTAQFENAVDTLEAHDFLVREGWAFVHVSAQAAGICCAPNLTPKTWDPVRYMPLAHPGDAWSFDLFTQVASAIRGHYDGVDPMGGLPVQQVIAAGQSQSASRLYGYVNGGWAQSRAIDAFLIHGGGEKNFDAPPPVPIVHLLSDAEADPVAPASTENYALWEIGGSSHTDLYVGYHQVAGQGPRAMGDQPQEPASADGDLHVTAANYGERPHPMLATCIVAGSTFPTRYAVKAALHHLDRWARTGARPPDGARFEFDDAGALVADDFGNTRGGIRYPVVDVPIATYQSTACPLGGITVPFTEIELMALYPTHTDYVCQLEAAAARTIAAGFLLPEDAAELLRRARDAGSRWLDAGSGSCSR